MFAPVVAQRPVMRVSRDGGRSYPARQQRSLTLRVPSQPAAVPTWGEDGTTRVVVFDLDSKRGDVAADCAGIVSAIEAAGGKALVDESPNGGRHIYLLLAEPVSKPVTDPLMSGLAARFPTLDAQPMRSIASGLIRPPGSPHKRGGHQTLITPWEQALHLAHHPNPAPVLRRIAAVFPPPATPTTQTTDNAPVVDGPERPLTGRWAAIARDGDTSGYPSPSEARQAVVWACVASSWNLEDLAHRLQTGQLPGLASLYHRYPTHARHRALARDWRNAADFEKRRRTTQGRSKNHQCNTRGQETHGGPTPPPTKIDDYRAIRAWVSAMRHAEHHRQMEPSSVLVLRALAQAAQREGRLTVSVGVRSLALATHLDPATVSRHLGMLRDQDEPLIVRITHAHALDADTYALVIPDSLINVAENRSWEPGKIRALHPCFRTLGHIAGFVYETLTTAREPLQALDIAAQVPWWSLNAIREALNTLAGWNMAHHTTQGWILGPASPDTVAFITDAHEIHHAIITTYRTQRRAWCAWLCRHRCPPTLTEPPLHEPPPNDVPEPPPPTRPNTDHQFNHAVELLTSTLGATTLVT